jgi:hypothetical protein
MQQLKEKSRSLLLLSATPMQINTSKFSIYCNFWDCEDIGLMSKKFCNYFSTWYLNYQGCISPMTFYPDIFDENASLQLMSFGNPLFEEMLKDLTPRPNCP